MKQKHIKKAKHDSVKTEQNIIEYKKSDDFEIFTYEEVKPADFIEDYINLLSARKVRINVI